MKHMFIYLFCILTFISCNKQPVTQNTSVPTESLTTIKYATGFKVRYEGNVKHVEVPSPYQGASTGFKYILLPAGEPVPSHEPDVHVITIPLQSIVCTSTSHIPLLDYLNETDKLIGFPSLDYVSSSLMRERIDAGAVTELGIDKGLNLERLVAIKPGMVMGYTMSSDYGQFKKIEELGIPVVINAEYLEKHPLGRSEWIKFVALFFNKEKEADSVFQMIEKNYLDAKEKASASTHRPTVMSGVVYGDAWFLPGGQNYAARLLQDAGCQYLWEADSSNGYLELSFEAVYEKAHQADLWIGVASYTSLKDIAKADTRYTRFKPYKTKQVYTYDMRKGAKGGSEYLELGYLRPDLILKDLLLIAHPELTTGDTLYFHKQLPDE